MIVLVQFGGLFAYPCYNAVRVTKLSVLLSFHVMKGGACVNQFKKKLKKKMFYENRVREYPTDGNENR